MYSVVAILFYQTRASMSTVFDRVTFQLLFVAKLYQNEYQTSIFYMYRDHSKQSVRMYCIVCVLCSTCIVWSREICGTMERFCGKRKESLANII